MRGSRPGERRGGRKPGTRNKSTAEVVELAKQYTAEAVDRLAHWMRSDDPKASVAAASKLLDRGHGMPKQTVDATVTRVVQDDRIQQLRQTIRGKTAEQHRIQ